MSDQNAPNPWPQGHAAPEPTPAVGPQTRFVEQATHEQPADGDIANGQRGLGPFTLREWMVIAAGVALTVLSFFSLFSGDVGRGYAPVWSLGIAWIGAVGLPLAAVVLLVLRRFLPRFRNVGGLSIDQVASVAFAVAAFVWLDIGIILSQISTAISGLISQFAGGLPFDFGGMFGVSAIVWVAFAVALIGVFFTVFARFVPPFADDFADREEVPAHATARPVRPLVKASRPRPAPVDAPAAAPGAAGVPPYAQQQPVPGAGGAHTAPQQAGDPHVWPQAPAAHGAPGPQIHDSFGHQAAASPQAHDPFGQQGRDPFAAPEARPAEQPADATSVIPVAQDPAAAGAPAVAGDAAAPAGGSIGAADAAPPAVEPSQKVPAVVPDAQDAGVAAPEARDTGDAAQRADEVAPETTPVANVAPAAASADPAAAASPDAAAPVAQAAPVEQEAQASAPQAAAPQSQAAPAAQPFWALVPVERDVHDFDGRPIFRIGPTAWALVLEDRDAYFVVRHDDGRIGYLHDTSGVTRG
ncbi:hypothetical protein [Microbacterium karelineae]|uniref:hypothetical protein n=1 Tax=Microbacterium karelineae TaxID=2654283 RepID=UPI001E2FF1E9|nr:hypothetical protein [Microbacterium karelineae]